MINNPTVHNPGDKVRVFCYNDTYHEGIVLRRCELLDGRIFYRVDVRRTFTSKQILPPAIKVLTIQQDLFNIKRVT